MEQFGLASVVVPAVDGTLAALGHKVRELGLSSLGFVIESRSSKCLVQFPELKICLWLDRRELADVESRAQNGDKAFKALLPDFSKGTPLVWWMWLACRRLKPKQILGFERGPLMNLWSDKVEELKQHYTGSVDEEAAYLALALPELILSEWEKVREEMNGNLLFARFLPAGMHKLELSLYLKC